MAFIEVVYELRDTAPILLATQSKIQPDGLPWKMVIENLGETPGMTNKALGITITDNHIEYYEDKGNNGVPSFDTSINFAAMTVFDMNPIKIKDLRDARCYWAETTWPLFDDVYNLLRGYRILDYDVDLLFDDVYVTDAVSFRTAWYHLEAGFDRSDVQSFAVDIELKDTVVEATVQGWFIAESFDGSTTVTGQFTGSYDVEIVSQGR